MLRAIGPLAGRQRRGDLRDAAVGGVRRGPTAVVEGPFADEKRPPFTAAGRPLHQLATACCTPSSSPGRMTAGSRCGPSRAARRTCTGKMQSVGLLGAAAPLKWSRDETGLHVRPPRGPADRLRLVLRVRKTDQERRATATCAPPRSGERSEHFIRRAKRDPLLRARSTRSDAERSSPAFEVYEEIDRATTCS